MTEDLRKSANSNRYVCLHFVLFSGFFFGTLLFKAFLYNVNRRAKFYVIDEYT